MDLLIENVQVFFLLFARIIALILVSPLLSSGAIPNIAKVGLALLSSYVVLPMVLAAGYPIPDNGLSYALFVLGEAMVGIIMGGLLVLIYAAFQVAGQFFSLQMGFGASEVFDPVSQVSIPLVGQFFNMVAMFVFVNVSGFQRIFLTGIYRSFQALSIQELADGREFILEQFLMSLSRLFEQALIISLPVLGTLLIVSTTMGLFGKAAPQMNLLMLGFPIAILVAFAVIFVTMPFLMEAFARIIDESFLVLEDILREVGGGI